MDFNLLFDTINPVEVSGYYLSAKEYCLVILLLLHVLLF